MDTLFEEVRDSCLRDVWSRGVELARAGAVQGERASGSEVVLRVSTRGGLLCPTVTLQPDEALWECDCGGAEDPCEHVAAAAIALRRARREGRELPAAASEAGHIRYRLERAEGGLALEREVVGQGRSERLVSTLTAVASGRVAGPAFTATRADLTVERALGPRLRGVLPPGVAPRVLAALADCRDLLLDGEPVRASDEPVTPRAVLEDAGEGFRLRVERYPDVRETFANGIALCADRLRPIGESRLSGRELEELPRGRYFPPDGAVDLVTTVLPSLRERVPVEVRTSRLPRTTSEPPRLLVETQRDGDALEVLPLIVYGDPPAARVDAGRLVPLRGAIPMRDTDEERRLTRRLMNKLELAPGHRHAARGEEAVRLADRLRRFPRAELRGRAHESFFLAPKLVPHLSAGASGDGDGRHAAEGLVTGAGGGEPGERGAGCAEVAAGGHRCGGGFAGGSRFELWFEAEGEGGAGGRGRARVDAASVIRAWRAGESLVPLAEGGLAPLPADWLERFGPRVADLLAARATDGSLPDCALPDLARLCDDLDRPRPPRFERLEALLEGFAGLPDEPLPADLRASLRGYQRRGVSWLAFLREAGLGGVLADDMGLGKTLEALCAVRGRTLVVCPTSVLRNWADEIARFRPGLRRALYHGPGRAFDPGADVTLTTYAILRLDADTLASEAWETVILDEAQAVKNPDSQAARAAYSLRARFRMALTGTPVENRLEELWSQLHFTNPGLLGGRADFQERYVRPIADGDPGAAQRLRERIRPFVLRRTKAEVAPELPPRTEVVLRCELDERERAVYEAVRAATREDVVRRLAAGGSVLGALEALLRLRQAACHAGLVPGQEAPTSSKVALLQDLLESVVAEGHKALVFSQWTSLLDRIEPALRAAEVGFTRLDGSTRDRAGVVDAFQDESGPPVMLVSLRAGGLGLNLTAADHVVLMDPWWNPAVEDQAADRAHRIGQHKPVSVYRLVAQGTVEERILALKDRKREIAAAALGEAARAAALTRTDLLTLLE